MTLRADLLFAQEKADALAHLAAIKRKLAAPQPELTREAAGEIPDTFLDSANRLPEE